MSDEAPRVQKYSFDEYKLYYESTDKVTDRRIATNTWNYGLCTAIVIAIAGLVSFASSRAEFRAIVLGVILVLSGMGVLFCTLWRGQIRDFKELNDAKFKVLEFMAPRVQFGTNETLVSAIPLKREWDILEERKTARELYSMQIIALRSSNAELLVPAAFRWLFVLAVAVVVAVTIANWTTVTGAIFDLKPTVGAGQATVGPPGKL